MTTHWEATEALARVQVLADHREMFSRMLEEAVEAACAAGVRRDDLAAALGVHRATFFRQFPRRSDTEETQHVE